MKDLALIRKDIDEIDQQIVKLFEQRMELTNQVAAYKQATGKAVYDEKREQEKLDKVSELAHLEYNKEAVRELFENIMRISRKKQYLILGQDASEMEKQV